MVRIMVVEDEAEIAECLVETLVELGYAVPAVASRADEALHRASEVQPDLVLMDIHLGGPMDGIEAAAELRRSSNIPVIYLSAFADDATIARARLTRPDGYLVKPFRGRDLRSAIEIALEHHSVDERLRDHAQRVERTLRSLGEAVVSADLEGHVTYMNPAAETLTGWRGADAARMPITEVCRIERSFAGTSGVVATPATARRFTRSVLVTREGRRVPIDDAIMSIVDDEEQAVGLVLVMRDISAQRDAHARIALSQRLESIAAMAGGLSHEINNPLAYVVANIDLALQDVALLAEPDDDAPGPKTLVRAARAERLEQLRSCLSAAASGAQRIRRLMADLRSFSDPWRRGLGVVDLGSAVQTAALLARPSIETRARLRVEVDALPSLSGSQPRLVKAISNLLIGAAGSIRPGNAEENEVHVRARAGERDRIIMEVTDTGAPMDESATDRLFDPFSRPAAASPPGDGLGMWLAHCILSEHGAEIRVESNAERGNRITVVLGAGADAA